MMAMGREGGVKHSNKNSKQKCVKRKQHFGEAKRKKKMNALYNILKRRGMHNMGWLSNYLA